MNKEEILELPDNQFLDWCKKVCKNPLIQNLDIYKNSSLIPLLKESLSKYYKSKEKISNT